MAQRHGSGSSSGQGGLSSYSRPDGVDDKDSLKDFHQVLAVQASGQQVTEFQALVKNTESAKLQLQAFVQQVEKEKIAASYTPAGTEVAANLESVVAANKKFVAGFSDAQKSGLRDLTKRMEHATSDLDQEQAKLGQGLKATAPSGAEILVRGEALDKALSEFSSQQLALGREMSIVVANGSDLSFNLPPVKRPVSIGGNSIAVIVSGALSQIEEQNGQRTFKLEMTEDLSDLQQNINRLLHAALDSGSSCGERISVREAMLTPSFESAVLSLQLHYERWSCVGTFGRANSTEIAENDGTVEVKLAPSVDKSNNLNLNVEFGRIDAGSMFTESLRSGDLGDDLRDKISRAVLVAVRAGTDFKRSLPSALENSALIQSARFHDAGAGVLSVVLEGKTQISNDQANLLASQLNQSMAEKTAATQ